MNRFLPLLLERGLIDAINQMALEALVIVLAESLFSEPDKQKLLIAATKAAARASQERLRVTGLFPAGKQLNRFQAQPEHTPEQFEKEIRHRLADQEISAGDRDMALAKEGQQYGLARRAAGRLAQGTGEMELAGPSLKLLSLVEKHGLEAIA